MRHYKIHAHLLLITNMCKQSTVYLNNKIKLSMLSVFTIWTYWHTWFLIKINCALCTCLRFMCICLIMPHFCMQLVAQLNWWFKKYIDILGLNKFNFTCKTFHTKLWMPCNFVIIFFFYILYFFQNMKANFAVWC